MSELPKGWTVASIAELAEFHGGGTPSKSDPSMWEAGEIPWVSPKDMKILRIVDSEDHVTEKALGKLTLAPAGAVLMVVRSGILVRTLPLAIGMRPVTVNQDMRVMVARTGIMPEYLMYQLISNESKILESCAKGGTTVASIEAPAFSRYQLRVAPSAEQIRIVAKLEELLSDLDAGVAELKAAQAKLGQYRQSLLKAAVDGSLTAAWRMNRKMLTESVHGSTGSPRTATGSQKAIPTTVRPELVEGRDSDHFPEPLATETGAQLLERILDERRKRWEAKQLAKFKEQGKTPPKGWENAYPEPVKPDTKGLPELPEGWVWASVQMVGETQLGRQRAPQFHSGANMVPYLRVANVFEDRIDVSDVMEMQFSEAEEETFRLAPGDILLNEGQSLELVGRSAIYRGELARACFTNTLVRYRTEPGVLVDFAQSLFLSYLKNGRFRKIATITTNIAHLGAGRFSELEFPLPSSEEQVVVVEILREKLAAIDRQQEAVVTGLKQAAAQRKNILKAAFSGQLVPQDPNDEPASVLLERIRAERAVQGDKGAKRGRKVKDVLLSRQGEQSGLWG